MRKGDPGEPLLVLGPLLRYVCETAVTIWVETDRACQVENLGHQARTFEVAGHHYGLVVVDGLRPGSECEYQVALDGAVCWPEPGSEFPPSGLLNTSVQVGSALGLGALAAIASIVTGSRLPGHTMAAALTDGYVAGLLAGSVIFAAGALVAVFTINARISAA